MAARAHCMPNTQPRAKGARHRYGNNLSANPASGSPQDSAPPNPLRRRFQAHHRSGCSQSASIAGLTTHN
mgnify:CR=1 FL=1